MNNYRILAIFANHTCNINKYNISLNNLSFIRDHVESIIIVDTINAEYSHRLKNDLSYDSKVIQHFFVENDIYLDFGRWIFALQHINYNNSNYDYILFINDSIIITSYIGNFFLYLNNTNNINIYGFNDSTQKRYHYQSYLFFLKKTFIDTFISFYESRKPNIHDTESLIDNLEITYHEIDPASDCFLKLAHEYNTGLNIYWENDTLYEYLLKKNILMLIKVKRLSDYKRDFNYHIYHSIPDNFSHIFYRNNYSDLQKLNDRELEDHYKGNGQYEGRRYDIYSIPKILPQFYRNKLKEIFMLQFFDIPDDFDIYDYKIKNKKISSLSPQQIIDHYLSNSNYKDSYQDVNAFYLNILKKFGYINHDVDYYNYFNIEEYLMQNMYLSNYGNLGIIYHYLKNLNKSDNINKSNKSENITISYDINSYINIRNGLIEYDNNYYLKFFFNFCLNKNLFVLPNDFDKFIYKRLYKDLNVLNDDQLENHFIHFGFKEGRLYRLPCDFNPDVYKSLYNDLVEANLSREDLINHFIEYGFREGRIYKLPNDFNIQLYRELHSEYKHLNDAEIIKKFSYTKGNRAYKIPIYFNYQQYKSFYDFLDCKSEDEIKKYYIEEGFNLEHNYVLSGYFDADFYKSKNSDIQNFDIGSLIKHFCIYGYNERRLQKLPDDFSQEKYPLLYSYLYG